MEKVLTKMVGVENSQNIDVYIKHGGYQALPKALKMTPDELIQMMKDAGVRGRGGAGFPTGMKWSFLPKDNPKPRYLLCNADESEPGTFKDRVLMEDDPHQVIEGLVISSFAIQANTCYIYIRGEYVKGALTLRKAIDEAYAKGYLGKNILGSGFNLDITVHRGAGAYICGEETGLIESLEGKRGWPRIKPPFPAVFGAFGCPTIVNNVETLVTPVHIINRGIQWWKDNEPKLYCMSGHLTRPGTYEAKMGTNLLTLINEHCGGIRHGRKLKAVIPGGSSVPVLRAEECNVNMDFDSLAKVGSALGSAGCMVMDETTCMVNALWNLLKFYAHESCGQCTPCREGTHWLEMILGRVETGKGRMEDLDLLLETANNIAGRTICPLGDAAAWPVAGLPDKNKGGDLNGQSFVNKFREEFEYHITNKKCMTTIPHEWN
ncbi:MAG TPA: NADH-quinone oxidoreductase subunit NuoF [bacterium]|nr:NADH-quinone oxidoreductase subunit NuoF [bacterium]HMW35159.1 NADH-quinone oxidoreductase subunit NuoF [bacterium]HMY35333.1 NADH-quinone oxidoreductase subunit NuoF [bacterium]HMZ03176.1 NADH-quinone oxidoreductase subunit NuoF [bacterium]HNB08250.1 NADH-quinone oxidoreductase subunit NuoF [bacterium]